MTVTVTDIGTAEAFAASDASRPCRVRGLVSDRSPPGDPMGCSASTPADPTRGAPPKRLAAAAAPPTLQPPRPTSLDRAVAFLLQARHGAAPPASGSSLDADSPVVPVPQAPARRRRRASSSSSGGSAESTASDLSSQLDVREVPIPGSAGSSFSLGMTPWVGPSSAPPTVAPGLRATPLVRPAYGPSMAGGGGGGGGERGGERGGTAGAAGDRAVGVGDRASARLRREQAQLGLSPLALPERPPGSGGGGEGSAMNPIALPSPVLKGLDGAGRGGAPRGPGVPPRGPGPRVT